MLTEEQEQALREAVKAAPEGDPLHVAYHKGDGKNRHDEYRTISRPVLDDKGKPVLDDKGAPVETTFDVDGIEMRELAGQVFTDAGGDIDAILAHFAGADEQGRRVWLPNASSALARASVDLDEFVSAAAKVQAKVNFLLGGIVLDFTSAPVREAFISVGPATAAAVAEVATRGASRFDALLLTPAGDHFISGAPAVFTRADVSDALFEQRGDEVVKR